ncbi:GntR family transcriptional regulator [uncultured Streptomyces sp.]|uniref:GntR family transcriptional regulator n=1 Tax=uncultured Streptomyces sp. TaxID=174707 RepID=UPI002609E8DB|nr:GntR family transcriptional regulator [uncultured Streptomyces sp.]
MTKKSTHPVELEAILSLLLRDQISTGDWPTGTALVLRLLAERYSTDRRTMRRVLDALAADGLVERSSRGWLPIGMTKAPSPPSSADTSPVRRSTAGSPPGVLDSVAVKARRIEGILRRRLEAGEYPPGSLFPRQADLCAEFSMSQTPVYMAVRALAESGLLVMGAGGRPTAVAIPSPGTPQAPLPLLTGGEQDAAHRLRTYIHLHKWRRGDLYQANSVAGLVPGIPVYMDLRNVLVHLREENLVEYQPPLGWRLNVAGTGWELPAGCPLFLYIDRELRDRFRAGRYVEGTRLSVRHLAYGFSAPQSQLRRVLRTLVSDGLLQTVDAGHVATGRTEREPPAPPPRMRIPGPRLALPKPFESRAQPSATTRTSPQ